MVTNTKADGEGTDHKAADIDAVVVEVDDIIKTFKRNRRDEDEQRSHVLRVHPPLEGTCRAKPFVSEAHNYYPPEMDPKPIHLGASHFVGYESGDGPAYQTDIPMPTLAESRRVARDDHGEDVDEDTVDEYHETAMDVWEDRVRGALLDEIEIEQRTADGVETISVPVQYE